MAHDWLQIRRGAQLVSNIRVASDRLVLGRAPDCDVVLNGNGVSRQHAEIERQGDGWVVRDLGSRNGVLVQGEKIAGPRKVAPGESIVIDVFELSLRAAAPPPEPRRVVQVADGGLGPARTMQQLAAPKIEAKHLSTLLSFSGDLLAAAAATQRQRILGELMIGPQMHGTAALLLRLRRRDPAAAPEAIAEPIVAGGGEPPHISRSLLQALLAGDAAVLATSQAGGPRSDVVKLSSVPAGASAAAVAVPLRGGPDHLDALYVTLPGLYGTAEWLALATMACALYLQAEDVWVAREAAQQQALFAEELRRAHDVQVGLVPRDFVVGKIDIAFGFEPSKGVGGDYVDALAMADGRVLLVAMDVAGKGLDAALVASGLHTTVHVCAAHGLPLGAMVRTLNNYLMATWATSVTMAACILDPRTGVIEAINCSHPNPLIVGPRGQVRELAAFETIPLGLTEFEIKTRADRLRPGELLAFYSDGLSELYDEQDRMFGVDGVTRALAAIAAARGDARAPALVAEVHARLAAFRGRAQPSDDVSFILALASEAR